MDWVVTLPQTVKWSDYEIELEAARDRKQVLNFHLPYKIAARDGDRCYVCWCGRVRGWMEVVGMKHVDRLVCSTTGKQWGGGWYLQRSGPFHKIDGPVMTGFRGIRRYP